jgi:GNAT superfamily N-acetyltransferase
VDDRADLSVTRAEGSDAERVAAFARDAFALACPDWADPADGAAHIAAELTAAAFAKDLATTGVAIYLAEFEGDVVGYAMLRGEEYPPLSLDARRPVELRRLYVRTEFHSRGASADLLAASVWHAHTHGYDVLWLGTNNENERALKFYGRNGFDHIGERGAQVGQGVHRDRLLSRRLEPKNR